MISRFCGVLVVMLAVSCGTSAGPVDEARQRFDVGTRRNPGLEYEHGRTSPVLGLKDSIVICDSCASDLLIAKRQGILDAMSWMVAYLGADVLPNYAPVTFHLEGGSVCGSAQDMLTNFGFLTGFAAVGSDGKGYVCLFDTEKMNRSLPFTADNAVLSADQVLPIHEAGHLWLFGRVDPYGIQEPFVKLVSFKYALPGVDACDWFKTSSLYPDKLAGDLCVVGMKEMHVPLILKRSADDVALSGSAVTPERFADIVTGIIGSDATPAFRAAGLIR